MPDERWDGILLQMCRGHDSMEGILNTFFSFLRRKTDFYHVLQGDERVGFPPGVADKLVTQAFARYKEQHAAAPSRADLERELERKNRRAAPAAAKAAGPAASPVATTAATGTRPPAATGPSESGSASVSASASPAPEPQTNSTAQGSGQGQGGVSRQEPLATYNGAREEEYSWAQTSTDVTMQLFVPQGTRARDVEVNFLPSKLSVQLKGKTEPASVLVGGELFEKVAVDECTWSLEVSNGEMTITMEKARERWWKSVFVGQGATEIDTTKVDSVKGIDEYDGETQGAIRKIMFDQDQKAKVRVRCQSD
jgi:hypothetical protein